MAPWWQRVTTTAKAILLSESESSWPDVVIAVELDLHCHLTEKMVSLSDIIITYKEYPHVDINARAEELFNLALAAQQKKIQPTMALLTVI